MRSLCGRRKVEVGGAGHSALNMDNLEKQWYVIHTYSGYENKVKNNLESRVQTMGMEDKIFRVLVPTEEELEVKNGKKKVVQRKVFPGYVLVEMIMTDDSWYVVRNTPGVTGFVGSAGGGSKPVPLLPNEVRDILRSTGKEEVRTRVDYEVGEVVRIVEGPFADMVGNVEEIHADQQKLRVLVSMFGRETPLEVDFSQVEKLS
ncbi:transcription termination/antitermination protein NusG [Alicyclobacillus contaminans]|nr:transcription termination/antitermination protein NusG [Alicyclobacillus contaminans]